MRENGMEYAVRWLEFDKQDRAREKEKIFQTEKAMEKFMDKVQEKDNFWRFTSFCG